MEFIILIIAIKNEIYIPYIVIIMASAVSIHAGSMYANFAGSLISDSSEENKAICPLTLANPAEVTKYFEWITIPSEKGKAHSFVIYGESGFANYFNMSLINNNIEDTILADDRIIDARVADDRIIGARFENKVVADPLRIYPNIYFMKTRLERLMSVSDRYNNLNNDDITPEFKSKILRNYIDNWASEPDQKYTNNDLGIIISLYDMYKFGLIYDGLNSLSGKDELFSRNPIKKSWLIRNSSMSNDSDNCSVFTIQFTYMRNITNTLCAFNIRCVSIHGIGIYILTKSIYDDIEAVNISDDIIKTANNIKILTAINWKPPQYACIIDLLLDLSNKDYINLNQFVIPRLP